MFRVVQNIPGYIRRDYTQPPPPYNPAPPSGSGNEVKFGNVGSITSPGGRTYDVAVDAEGKTILYEDDYGRLVPFVLGDYFQRESGGGGGGGADYSHVYAQIAEEARQFNEQLAFQRERERNAQALNKFQAQVAREQMMQDWYRQQAQDQLARRAMANDAATSAMNAFTANVGTANIPGIENWRPHTQPGGADPSTNAPVLRLNPSLAMGHQASRPANIPAPIVPDLVY